MLPLARTGLTAPAVAGRGLSEGLGVAGGQEVEDKFRALLNTNAR
jgi:hypothetical protein